MNFLTLAYVIKLIHPSILTVIALRYHLSTSTILALLQVKSNLVLLLSAALYHSQLHLIILFFLYLTNYLIFLIAARKAQRQQTFLWLAVER